MHITFPPLRCSPVVQRPVTTVVSRRQRVAPLVKTDGK